jgi:hypothetical protein
MDFINLIPKYSSIKSCPDLECEICSYRNCFYQDFMYYHHDSCISYIFQNIVDYNKLSIDEYQLNLVYLMLKL